MKMFRQGSTGHFLSLTAGAGIMLLLGGCSGKIQCGGPSGCPSQCDGAYEDCQSKEIVERPLDLSLSYSSPPPSYYVVDYDDYDYEYDDYEPPCDKPSCDPPPCEDTSSCDDSSSEPEPEPAPEPEPEPCTPVYTLTPPGTYAGDECVRVCYRERNKCIEKQRHRKETCDHYNRMARLEFGRCIASGASNCYNSVKDNECQEPDPEVCDAELRYCYTACGGTVTNSCEEMGNDSSYDDSGSDSSYDDSGDTGSYDSTYDDSSSDSSYDSDGYEMKSNDASCDDKPTDCDSRRSNDGYYSAPY